MKKRTAQAFSTHAGWPDLTVSYGTTFEAYGLRIGIPGVFDYGVAKVGSFPRLRKRDHYENTVSIHLLCRCRSWRLWGCVVDIACTFFRRMARVADLQGSSWGSTVGVFRGLAVKSNLWYGIHGYHINPNLLD